MQVNVDAIWTSVCGELEVSMSEATFSYWIKPCFIRGTTEIDSERLIVELASPSAYHLQQIEARYYGQIKQALEKQLEKRVELAMVVGQKATRNSEASKNDGAIRTGLFEERRIEQPETKGLFPRFTFENFVVGGSNNLAYAAAKAGADRLVYSYMETYKLPAVIIRPFNMFGPNQHLEKLIPRFITSCILNEPLTIHGSGTSRRDFTYVDDLARAIDLVLHAPAKKVVGEVFNVGYGKDVSVQEIADLIIDMMNHLHQKSSGMRYSASPLNIGDRPGQVFRHTADTSKIERALCWKPKVAFKEGLIRTIDWYLKNEWWWKDKMWMRHVPVETEKGKTEMH